jgi:hypothetical protein
MENVKLKMKKGHAAKRVTPLAALYHPWRETFFNFAFSIFNSPEVP